LKVNYKDFRKTPKASRGLQRLQERNGDETSKNHRLNWKIETEQDYADETRKNIDETRECK
jgi:hypothetical protein